MYILNPVAQLMSWVCQAQRNGCMSKTPTCCWQWWGSIGGHIRYSVSVWCGTDLTGDVVVWREETAVQKRKWDKTPNNRCALESDPARDSAVMWSGTGQRAKPEQAVVEVMWYDAWRTHGRGGLDQSPLLFSPLVFLFISLSHTCAHTNIRSLSHSPLSSLLCKSYLSHHAATHFPSLFNSFLSIQYSPLSHFLSRSCSILLSPRGMWVCHAVQSSGHGCGSTPTSNG